MILRIRCPNSKCESSSDVDVKDEHIGRVVKCKRCGTRFPLIGEAPPSPPIEPRTPPTPPGPDTVKRLSGIKIGRYEIIEKIGEGGMGVVYLARDPDLDRNVALKMPHPTYGGNREVVDRFIREARLAARINHANICPIYDVGRTSDGPYLAMAYIEGRTLAGLLKERGRPMGQRVAAKIIRTLAQALQEAHRLGIVHRDLKPSNVMINKSKDELVIMDFGLARRFDNDVDDMTKTGGFLGTPHYSPPEQIAVNKALIGPRSDVYSLGVILYELLTARRPVDGAALDVSIKIVSNDPFTPPSQYRPRLDKELEAVCLKAMSKKPEDRYQSMREFARALNQYIKSREGVPEPDVVKGPATTEQPIPADPEPRAPSSVRPSGVGIGEAPPESPPPVAAAPEPQSEPYPPVQVTSVESTSLEVVSVNPTADVPGPPSIKSSYLGMKLVRIPSGSFHMGSPPSDRNAKEDEKPRREVYLSRSYYVAEWLVTQGWYQKVFEGKPGFQDPSYCKGSADLPVERVTWFDALEFCNELSKLEKITPYYILSGKGDDRRAEIPDRLGVGYRLPTEAEWERACRGGGDSLYSFGDNPADLPKYAWFGEGFGGRTQPAGKKPANPYGLHDVHGNVGEWCWDWYDDRYYERQGNVLDPLGPESGTGRVLRGGSFVDAGRYLRSACRFKLSPIRGKNWNFGFRVARYFIPEA